MTQLLRRLRERKLAQWGLAYLASAWALLQVLDLVGRQFDWSTGLLRGITVALGVGFFATLVLAFYHGERGAQKIVALRTGPAGVHGHNHASNGRNSGKIDRRFTVRKPERRQRERLFC